MGLWVPIVTQASLFVRCFCIVAPYCSGNITVALYSRSQEEGRELESEKQLELESQAVICSHTRSSVGYCFSQVMCLSHCVPWPSWSSDDQQFSELPQEAFQRGGGKEKRKAKATLRKKVIGVLWQKQICNLCTECLPLDSACDDHFWSKCTVLVIQHHCNQAFSTHCDGGECHTPATAIFFDNFWTQSFGL